MTQTVTDQEAAQVRTYFEARRKIIEPFLREQLPPVEGPGRKLFEAMRYSVEAGGKRLRPVLALAAADYVASRNGWDDSVHAWWTARGPEAEAVLLFACALEYIHTYSLIHDDLPCMDDDELRRGMPTCHVAHGEATALLAGDALNTDAFSLLAEVAPEFRERALLAIGELARAAGSGGMVTGQSVDLEATGGPADAGTGRPEPSDKETSMERLVYIHRHKTAALIRCSLVGGGLIAGAGRDDLQVLSDVGERVGLLFQVVDDILDVTGDTATLGKTAGRDEFLDKLTYPALLGLEQARNYACRLMQETLAPLETAGDRAEPLAALVRFVASRSS